MHSSISSFDANGALPGRPAWRPWGLALLFALLCLGGLELSWRARGFRPSGTDDRDSWCLQRERLAGRRARNVVVVLGASRIQIGFVPSVFEKEFPGKEVVNLAFAGSTPMATLQDLAEREPFSGVVLCSAQPQYFLPERWPDQEGLARYFRDEWGPRKRLSLEARLLFQENLVFLLPQLQLQRVVPALIQGRLPGGQFLIIHPDRSWEMRFDLLPDLDLTAQFLRFRLEQIFKATRSDLSPSEWSACLARVEVQVERIQNRGGRVVFWRLPSSGAIAELEERAFPRERYWEPFARATKAETLHWADLPGMRALHCPDGSHLDHRDSVRATRALAEELSRRGVL